MRWTCRLVEENHRKTIKPTSPRVSDVDAVERPPEMEPRPGRNLVSPRPKRNARMLATQIRAKLPPLANPWSGQPEAGAHEDGAGRERAVHRLKGRLNWAVGTGARSLLSRQGRGHSMLSPLGAHVHARISACQILTSTSLLSTLSC